MVTQIGREGGAFAAIADPTRRAIIEQLSRGPLPVNRLAGGFAMSRPAVSKHLRILREAKLIRVRCGDDKRQRMCELTPGPLHEVSRWLERYERFWTANLMSLKTYVESEE